MTTSWRLRKKVNKFELRGELRGTLSQMKKEIKRARDVSQWQNAPVPQK